MGYDLFGAILFAALTPLVVLGFIVFWVMTSRERAFIEDTWASYAAARGRAYFPARGEWPNRTSPGVRWTESGILFELTAVGVEAGARTRLVARPRERLLGAFFARFESDRLVITERPAGLADRVLDEGARRTLLAFRQRDDVTLRYRRGRVVLEWPGRESNDARIDEASRVALALAKSVDVAFGSAAARAA